MNPSKNLHQRRYDIDSLRVVAIFLLIFYHLTVVFQPWGSLIPGFFQNEISLDWIWFFSGLMNVWRIPILFVISGMGVAFSMRKRNLKELLSERCLRILLPLFFGIFIIVPLQFEFLFLQKEAHQFFSSYSPNPSHLWFLANIFIYVLFCSPIFFYLKKKPDSWIGKTLKFLTSSYLGLAVLVGIFCLESEILVGSWRFGRVSFESYAGTDHGFFIGLLCFLSGFAFIFFGDFFWKIVEYLKKITLFLAFILYFLRLSNEFVNPPWAMAIESWMWMFAIFGYFFSYRNKKNKIFIYLSPAAYPFYITHMLFMNISCFFLIPMNINPLYKFLLILSLTFFGCFFSYEFLIRRVSFLRPLFGLKTQKKTNTN
tara:strand:+ start:2923 stop:4032 length:1110 start_codon:yes stop_codon:yes gene_type:complete